jgi:hypothetical protein
VCVCVCINNTHFENGKKLLHRGSHYSEVALHASSFDVGPQKQSVMESVRQFREAPIRGSTKHDNQL